MYRIVLNYLTQLIFCIFSNTIYILIFYSYFFINIKIYIVIYPMWIFQTFFLKSSLNKSIKAMTVRNRAKL